VIREEWLKIWKQVEPTAVVQLKPGERVRIGKWLVEKGEDGVIRIYEIEDDK